jgi:hypothetical protein
LRDSALKLWPLFITSTFSNYAHSQLIQLNKKG